MKRKRRKVIIRKIFLLLIIFQIVIIPLLFYNGEDGTNYYYNDIKTTTTSSTNFFLLPPKTIQQQQQQSNPTTTKTTTTNSSYFHCIGDNFLKNSWMYRSCQYHNICYKEEETTATNTTRNDNYNDGDDGYGHWFLYPQSKFHIELQQELLFDNNDDGFVKKKKYKYNKYTRIATMASPENNFTIPPYVSIAVGPKTTNIASSMGKWSPTILQQHDHTTTTTTNTTNFVDDMIIIPISISLENQKEESSTIIENNGGSSYDITSSRTLLTILTDILLPIYNLIGMFGYNNNKSSSSKKRRRHRRIAIHIMNNNNNCVENNRNDDDDCLSKEYLSKLEYIIRNWMGYDVWKPPHRHRRPTSTTKTKTTTCFKYGIAGTGMLTVTGQSKYYKNGYHWKDYNWDITQYKYRNNVGRGYLFYDFTRHIIMNLNINKNKNDIKNEVPSSSSSTSTTSAASISITQIVLAGLDVTGDDDDDDDVKRNLSSAEGVAAAAAASDLAKRLLATTTTTTQPKSRKLDPKFFRYQEIPPYDNIKQQQKDNNNNNNDDWMINLASSSHVWISIISAHKTTTMTWPAMFLPRNSTLILLYDENYYTTNKPQKKQKQNVNNNNKRIPIRSQYDFWNNLSHLKVHWVSMQHYDSNNSTSSDLLVDWIIDQIIQQQPQQAPLSHSHHTGGTTTTTTTSHYFNSIPVQYQDALTLPTTRIHCVGNNFQEYTRGDYQSCQYENLCFDTQQQKFVFIHPLENIHHRRHQLQPRPFDSISTGLRQADVQMGQSIRLGNGEPWIPVPASFSNTTTTNKQQDRQKHTKEKNHPQPPSNYDSYYQLPSNVIWLPYYPEQPNVNNPGHLLWDYWLPLFTLADMFGHTLDKQLLLTNIDPYCVPLAAARIDSINQDQKQQQRLLQQQYPGVCYKMISKFLPLLGVHPSTFVSTYHSKLMNITNPSPSSSSSQAKAAASEIQKSSSPPSSSSSSSLVCASRTLVGIGMLTDHGYQKHGQLIDDYQNPYNHGRGINFWRFRNFMMYNMRIFPPPTQPSSSSEEESSIKFTITFSILSSNNPKRRRSFDKQIDGLETYFSTHHRNVQIRKVRLSDLSLGDQISIVQESDVFISVIGGSTSTAMFLERNSCLVLYYNDYDDEFVKKPHHDNDDDRMPAMLDWGFWNHASYLKVHWLPLSSMDNHDNDNNNGIRILTTLIETELEAFPYWH